MSSYNPGDVFVNNLVVSSGRGTLNLTKIFLSAKIFESIFTPGIIGHIEVLDTEDYIGNLKLSGDETVNFSFKSPDRESLNYNLSLNSVDEVQDLGSMKAKVYQLTCVSTEVLKAKAGPIQKSYNTQISSMVSDVFSSFLSSSKSIDIEATKGIQRFISPSLKPFSLIKELKKRAVSLENKSSNFLFFENADGFKFKTIEGLVKAGVSHYFKQEDTVGSSYRSSMDNNILAYKLYKQMSATDRIGMGGLSQKTGTFDIRTNEYKVETKKINESDYTFGGLGSMSSSAFKSLFGNLPGIFTFINKNSKDPNTYLQDGIVDKAAYLSSMSQNQLDIEVPGNSSIKAGEMALINIPKKVSITGMNSGEVLVNGKFLLAKVAHIIKRPSFRPRYVVSMECLKGAYEQGV